MPNHPTRKVMRYNRLSVGLGLGGFASHVSRICDAGDETPDGDRQGIARGSPAQVG